MEGLLALAEAQVRGGIAIHEPCALTYFGIGNGQGGGYGGAHASVGTTPQRGGCDSGIPTAPITVGDADITRAYFGGVSVCFS
jgi:hypothetical protein